jgi:hypothetical protein
MAKRVLRNLNAKHDGAGTFELRTVGLHCVKSGTDLGRRSPIALLTAFLIRENKSSPDLNDPVPSEPAKSAVEVIKSEAVLRANVGNTHDHVHVSGIV